MTGRQAQGAQVRVLAMKARQPPKAVMSRIVSRIAHGHDFYEGVRAVVIDKDQAPRWQPDRLEAVEPAAIAAYFAPLGAAELKLEG